MQLYRSKTGNYIGSVYVVPPDKPGWYARIETNGSLTLNQANTFPGLEEQLRSLAANPAAYAADYGKMHGNCCFCSLPLSDKRSLEAGYGPVCAENYGLLYPKKKEGGKQQQASSFIPSVLAEEISRHLAMFTSSNDECYQHPLGMFNYSVGVKYLATAGNCYWLLDAIASWQLSSKVKNSPMNEGFQIWQLTRTEGTQAVLTGAWDTNQVVVTQEIEYTDFPISLIKLWLENGLLSLPNER